MKGTPDTAALASCPAADTVTLIARRALHCADGESLAGLESPFRLGPLDQLVLPFVPIAVVFLYRKPTSGASSSELLPMERLARALALLLDYYPHLTGRLQINPSDKTPEISQLGTGAELFIAQCSERLDTFCPSLYAGEEQHATGRILMKDLPAAGNALLAPFDPTLEGVCRDPIFVVQHTRFACGGVALGVRLHHIVCDADGFFRLVHDLAEIYRGVRASETKGDPSSGIGVLARPPHIRSYLWELWDMTPEERQAALDVQPAHYYVESSDHAAVVAAEGASTSAAEPPASAVPPAQPPVIGRVLRFSGRELDALKAHATDPSGGSWVSTFEALSAHLYQSVYRARLWLRTAQGVPLSAAVSEVSREFLTSVNWRGRDRLDLPPRYFPNACFIPYSGLPHDVLADGPLWQVAKALHDWTRALSPEKARQTLRWIAAQPDKTRVKIDFCFQNSFMVSQWCKFDMYVGVDFDVDEHGEAVLPALVGPPFTPILLVDGLAYFLATEEQLQGGTAPQSIDVNLALSEPLWAILDQDEGFRQFHIMAVFNKEK
ncbi:Transferase [Balamuthia mandrillaris]